MTTTNTDTRCPHCNADFANSIGKHSCHFDLEFVDGRTKLCREREAHRKLEEIAKDAVELLEELAVEGILSRRPAEFV